MKATELLKKQHRSVHGLFGELKKLDGAARRTPSSQRGAAGWGFLWLIGIPVPVLLALFLMRGCT